MMMPELRPVGLAAAFSKVQQAVFGIVYWQQHQGNAEAHTPAPGDDALQVLLRLFA